MTSYDSMTLAKAWESECTTSENVSWLMWCMMSHEHLCQRLPCQVQSMSGTTAVPDTPIGTSDGLHTRSPGAAITTILDVQEPGMAVTTFTRTSFQKVWAMSMAISMTAMLVSPIGRPDGPIPRRNGAAPVRNEDVSSTSAS